MCDSVDNLGLSYRAVGDIVQEPLHVRLANSCKVITDTQVEQDRRVAGVAELVMQRVNQNPGAQIFLEGFMDF